MEKEKTESEFFNWRKTQLDDFYRQHCQLKECTDVEPSRAIEIPLSDGKFSFQCRCGERHLFQHTGSKEGVLLEVKLP